MNFNTDLEGGMEGGKKNEGENEFWRKESDLDAHDSHSDSGHVSSKPGYGWESDNRHLAYDEGDAVGPSSDHEVKVPVVEKTRTPVMPVASNTPSSVTRDPRSVPSWPFWWLLFILLILAIGATVGFSIWDTKLVRDDYFQSERTLHGRIDSTDAQSQNRLQERATAIEQRLNQLSQRVSDLQSENAALRAKLESTQMMCQQSCTNETTK
jgi:hypothetical protein